MKATKRISSAALVAMLMMSVATLPASAQFKGLGSKLKNKAEKVLKEKVDEKKSEVTSQVTPSSEPTSDGAFDYKKKYTPSAEAAAADPLAKSTEIEEGYTKSVGDIHASYENMPDDIIISCLKPYYTDNNKIMTSATMLAPDSWVVT